MAASTSLWSLGFFFFIFAVAHCQYRSLSDSLTFEYVSTSVNYIWGVSANNSVYKCDRPCDGDWVEIPGQQLVQLDAGDQEVWGVDSAHAVYKRPVDGSGYGWEQVQGPALAQVSASGNGYIWGVTPGVGIVHKCKKPCSGSWSRVDIANLTQIDGEYGYWYGVNKLHYIYARPIDNSRGPPSRRIPGPPLKHITASSREDVFGLGTDDKVYRCKKPCVGEWELMAGSLKQCDGTFDSIVGIDSDGNVFELKTGI